MTNTYQMAQFVLDCLTVIEMQATGLSRYKIRHALSIGAPLGTPSATIDDWWTTVCDTLNFTNLVTERDGVFFWKPQNEDNPAVN